MAESKSTLVSAAAASGANVVLYNRATTASSTVGFCFFMQPQNNITTYTRSHAWKCFNLMNGGGVGGPFLVPNDISIEVVDQTGFTSTDLDGIPRRSKPIKVAMGQRYIWTMDASGVSAVTLDPNYTGTDLQVQNKGQVGHTIGVVVTKNGSPLFSQNLIDFGSMATITLNPNLFMMTFQPGSFKEGQGFRVETVGNTIYTIALSDTLGRIPALQTLTYTDSLGPTLSSDLDGAISVSSVFLANLGAPTTKKADSTTTTTTIVTTTEGGSTVTKTTIVTESR